MTYSIVARDAETGRMGVAVQSHFFAVGRIVCWGEAGVGVVATQSYAEPSYGYLGLELMRRGIHAAAALAHLTAVDDRPSVRQVAMLDARGAVAVHTGADCIPEAGHLIAEGVSAQANLMARDTVPAAMLAAYEGARGDIVERLLAALDAAEAEGGDVRGRQSAALLVVGGTRTGKPWEDRWLDLRVDDDPEPLVELRRLAGLWRAYDDVERGERLALEQRWEESASWYARGVDRLGDNPEGAFWFGVSLASAGRVDEARAALAPALRAHGGWADLLRRLPSAGLLPDDPTLLERLLADD